MAKVLADGLNRTVFPLGETIELKLNEPRPETLELPFYKLLPKDHLDLIRFRIYVRRRCIKDVEFRTAILQMCRKDPLFWANTFCCVFEPRPPRSIPLKMWNDQADLFAILWKWYGVRSVGVGKSRGIGGSWTVSMLYAYVLLFVPESKNGILSKDEDSVDSDDENSMLGKVAYQLEKLPYWMTHDLAGRPYVKRNKGTHLFINQAVNTTLQGFPATDNKVRGMRFSSLFHDESSEWPGDTQAAAATAIHTTNNRIYIGTFKGSNNAHYDMMYRDKTSLLRVFMWWWNNEARSRGMYTTQSGRCKIIDQSYQFPPNYPFVLDGRTRSPYVDAVEREAGPSRANAVWEELNGITSDSGRKLFRSDTIQLLETLVKPQLRSGTVQRNADGQIVFLDDPNGKTWVWGARTGTDSGGPYSAASDLGAGRGAAYTTFEAIDLATGEQVVEWADNELDPVSAAQYVRLLLDWLNAGRGQGRTCFTYENNGDIGNSFGDELLRLAYRNIMRRPYKVKPQDGAESHYYGMRNKDGGTLVFGELERAIRDAEMTVRSIKVKEEMELFDREEKTNGKYKPAFPAREDGHGDRAFGLAMAWFQGREKKVAKFTDTDLSNEVTQATPSPGAIILTRRPQKKRSWSAGWRLTG